jgi:hypothetical protein
MQSDYTRVVKLELAKGVRMDSVIFGINLGDTREEFYGRCFDLNKQQLVTQGPGSTVQYLFTDSVVHQKAMPLRLLFIPVYDEANKIIEMNMEFSYPGWAPWNADLQAEALRPRVQDLLLNWYGGNEFVQARINNSQLPVKVDGNRRMIVYVKDARNVVVKVQDLLHPRYQHSISAGADRQQ